MGLVVRAAGNKAHAIAFRHGYAAFAVVVPGIIWADDEMKGDLAVTLLSEEILGTQAYQRIGALLQVAFAYVVRYDARMLLLVADGMAPVVHDRAVHHRQVPEKISPASRIFGWLQGKRMCGFSSVWRSDGNGCVAGDEQRKG